MRNDLLISDVILKERTAIHGNIDPKLIYPTIKTSQDMYILPIIGTALYIKLQNAINDNTIITDANLINYKNLLDLYIIDALIWYVLYDLPTELSYQFWNKGIVRKQGQDTDMPSMSDLLDIGNRNKNKAEFYANRLKRYLQQYAYQMYPEYLQPGNTIDTIFPDPKSFTSPIYLGEYFNEPNKNRSNNSNDCDCPYPGGWDKNRPYGQ